MKVKIFKYTSSSFQYLEEKDIEREINNFIKDVDVIDIKITLYPETQYYCPGMIYTILYNEKDNKIFENL